jgi:hypothetical protein
MYAVAEDAEGYGLARVIADEDFNHQVFALGLDRKFLHADRIGEVASPIRD